MMYPGTGKEMKFKKGRTDPRPRFEVEHSFKNYEVTAYFQMSGEILGIKINGPCHGSGCPSGLSDESSPCCWYDVGFRNDGEATFQKEQPHPDNVDVPCKGPCRNVGSQRGKLVGFKAVIINPGNGRTRVQTWVDTSGKIGGNRWIKQIDFTEDGSVLPLEYRVPEQQETEFRVEGEMKFGTLREISVGNSQSMRAVSYRISPLNWT